MKALAILVRQAYKYLKLNISAWNLGFKKVLTPLSLSYYGILNAMNEHKLSKKIYKLF